MGCLSLALILLRSKLSVYVDMSPKKPWVLGKLKTCGLNYIFRISYFLLPGTS